MALLYPWATKEYLLWNMTLGQIVMYYNGGMEGKYGREEQQAPKITPLSKKSHAELKKVRDELRRQYGDI
jgi:hypothetical protein